MDEKEKAENFMNMLDSFMENGGTHLKAGEAAVNTLLGAKDDPEMLAELAKQASECPSCANIPNISDTDNDY